MDEMAVDAEEDGAVVLVIDDMAFKDFVVPVPRRRFGQNSEGSMKPP